MPDVKEIPKAASVAAMMLAAGAVPPAIAAALPPALLEALALGDRYMYDEDLRPIDKMGRSARRNAINRDGYPKPRRIGLRSAWLLSEVLSWMRAKPHVDPHNKGARKRKVLSEGIK